MAVIWIAVIINGAINKKKPKPQFKAPERHREPEPWDFYDDPVPKAPTPKPIAKPAPQPAIVKNVLPDEGIAMTHAQPTKAAQAAVDAEAAKSRRELKRALIIGEILQRKF